MQWIVMASIRGSALASVSARWMAAQGQCSYQCVPGLNCFLRIASEPFFPVDCACECDSGGMQLSMNFRVWDQPVQRSMNFQTLKFIRKQAR